MIKYYLYKLIIKILRIMRLLPILPDKLFLQMYYLVMMKEDLDLRNPKTFNQKLQWLKLYNRKDIYTTMVDKYAVKKYVAELIGEEYIIPTLGVWDHFDDIDFSSLPDQFVLKCTHDSGGLVIVRDKQTFDKKAAKKKIENSLKNNYHYSTREWPYKNVPPRIIAEQYMEDESGGLTDYKFFCFNGVADNVMIVADRSIKEPKFYHFSKDWRLLRYNRLCRKLPDGFTIPKPSEMDQMFELAEKMSIDIPHVRIDFYLVNGQIYFGEYTFFNESGFETGFDDYSDNHLGSLIKLPIE